MAGDGWKTMEEVVMPAVPVVSITSAKLSYLIFRSLHESGPSSSLFSSFILRRLSKNETKPLYLLHSIDTMFIGSGKSKL